MPRCRYWSRQSRRPAASTTTSSQANNAFNTIVGDIRFNELGEWATARMLLVQFQNVQGSGLDQYMTGHKQVILYPPEYKDRELGAPFPKYPIMHANPPP